LPNDRKDQTKPVFTASAVEKLLTPAEKARQLGVSVDTLRRWENEGRIDSTRTAGGQRRYRADAGPRAAVATDADDDGYEPATLSSADVARSMTAPPMPPWQERIEERRADVEVASWTANIARSCEQRRRSARSDGGESRKQSSVQLRTASDKIPKSAKRSDWIHWCNRE
jgi:excisionase family DNA binding protein